MDEPVLSARAYLDAIDIGAAYGPDVVLVFDAGLAARPGLVRRMLARLDRSADTTRARRRHPFRDLTSLGTGVDLVVSSPGSPVAAATLELLAASGVRRVVSVGAAAALAPMETGTWAIVTEAVQQRPLDYPSDCTRPDADLTSLLRERLGATPVITCTTDVPFRQTPGALRHARASAQVLEMECGSLFQVADALGLAVASCVVVSDHYDAAPSWRPGSHDTLDTELRKLVDAVEQALLALP